MTTATLCCHYYDIEPPDGLISIGVCRDCGKSKEFYNAYPIERHRRISTPEGSRRGGLNGRGKTKRR